MRKVNFIIGKRQIVLASLTLILGIAIYINYMFTQSDGKLNATDVIGGININYGDSQFVSGNNSEDYFAQTRLERMKARDTAVETLKSILEGGDITEEEKAVYTQKAEEIAKLVESETKIESLIKAAGFSECVVYLDGTTASIVVKSDGLIPSQVAQIKDILLSEVDIKNENIRIFDVK